MIGGGQPDEVIAERKFFSARIARLRRNPTTNDSQRRIGLHVGRLLSGEVINRGCRFAATVVIARALSTSDFGVVNVGIAISGIALIVTSLGLPDQGAREVAVSPQRAGWIAGRVVAIRMLAVVSISVIAIPAVALLWPGHVALSVVAALMSLFMAAQTDWLGRGTERMSVVAASTAVGGWTVLLAASAVAAVGATSPAMLGAFALGEAIVAAFLWVMLSRYWRMEFGLRGAGAMLRKARLLALSSLAIYMFYANLDTIIIAATRSNREAGLYTAPYRLFLVLNLVGLYAAYAMLPTLSRLAEERNNAEADRLLHSSLRLLAAYGLLVLGIVELVGADVLGLVFGSQFRAAGGTFVLLVSGVAWYVIGYPTGYSLIARGQNNRFLRGAGTASVLNIALDFALIPPLGMKGAGVATMIAFDVAAIVWLSGRGLLTRGVLPVLTALTVTSAGAAFVVFDNRSTTVAGLATLATGCGVMVYTLLRRSGQPVE